MKPWEGYEGVRRDCDPHRAVWLFLYGAASAFLGGASVFVLPIVVALPLALSVYVLSNRDLNRMSQGLMDPDGRRLVEQARQFAMASFALMILAVLVVAGVFMSFWLMQ